MLVRKKKKKKMKERSNVKGFGFFCDKRGYGPRVNYLKKKKNVVFIMFAY
jgi:hypothetical protein